MTGKIGRILKKSIIMATVAFLLAGAMPALESYAEPGQVFSDVKNEDWFSVYVNKLYKEGGIEGYPDKTFRPNQKLTKAEFVKLLMSSLGYKNLTSKSSHWSGGYVDLALEKAIVSKADTKNPDKAISRKEMAVIIANTLSFMKEPEVKQAQAFKPLIQDIERVPPADRTKVLEVYAKGIISGYPDGTFRGNNSLSRAEASAVIVRILYVNERLANKRPIPVLMYHHILPEADIQNYGWKGNQSVVSAEDFARQMDYIHKNGFNTISLKDLEAYLDKKLQLTGKNVVITFDDGYLSNGTYAYPVMKKYEFKGGIFLIGEHSHRRQKDFSPDGLQYIEFSSMGKYEDVFEFASHGYALHAEVNGVPLARVEDRTFIEADLARMKIFLASGYLAYPYGAYTRTVFKAMEQEGYSLGFTTDKGYVYSGTKKLQIPRFGIKQSTSFEEFINIVEIR